MLHKIGIYAGSFDPFHIGHLNILEKAEKLFNTVVIARGQNPEKHTHVEDLPESITDEDNGREFYYYNGLLSDFIKEKLKFWHCTPEDFILIRGLRNSMDLLYEQTQMKYINDLLGFKINVVYIPCDAEFEHISSSAIKNLMKYKNGNHEKYLVK